MCKDWKRKKGFKFDFQGFYLISRLGSGATRIIM